ncbi:hypothetical protein PO909_031469 [Leuciscus waleckii]
MQMSTLRTKIQKSTTEEFSRLDVGLFSGFIRDIFTVTHPLFFWLLLLLLRVDVSGDPHQGPWALAGRDHSLLCLHSPTESDCIFFIPTQKKTATLPTLPTSSLLGCLRGLSGPGPAGHNLHVLSHVLMEREGKPSTRTESNKPLKFIKFSSFNAEEFD